MFEQNTFCSGAAFVPKQSDSSRTGTSSEEVEEDDGWVITFVHNEDTNISQVSLYIQTGRVMLRFIYLFDLITFHTTAAGLCY